MPSVRANRKGNSGAEEGFIELFCDVFGPERGQCVYLQYPFVDIHGRHRTIGYAIHSNEGRIAVEVDGNQWHQPRIVSEDKYHGDLLKQKNLIYEGWKIYCRTSLQTQNTPERIQG